MSSKLRQKIFYHVGACNYKLSNFEAAKESFSEALRIDETDVKALLLRAKCHLKLKEFENCIIDCEESLKLEPLEAAQKLMSDAKFSVKISKGLNAYKILGVGYEATKAELKKAFHKLSLLYHSDKNPKATAIEKKKLERRFREAQTAYSKAMSLLK